MNQTAQELANHLLAQAAPNYPMLFRNRVAETPDTIAFTIPQGEGYRDVAWRHVRVEVDELAAGLIALGLRPEDRVAICSSTRYEWVVTDLAIACAGGATTTIYPNTNAEEVHFILADSGSVMAILENSAQLAKVRAHADLDEQVLAIVLIDDDRAPDQRDDQRVIGLPNLSAIGREKLAAEPGCLDERISQLTLDSLSTLIYTSGTTGRPKGVELLHRSWVFEGEAMKYWDFVSTEDVLYLWLPLSHVFGRDLLAVQLTIGFRSVVDGRVDKIIDGLGQTNPTILVGVPRIFEKVRAAVMTMNPQKGFRGRMARWAFAVGRESRPYRLAGRKLPAWLKLRYRIADRLVFQKLHAKLGGRMRLMISGSAKLSPQVQMWFYSAGLTIVEGYGATETSAITFFNKPDRPRFGTVGPVIPGVETKLGPGDEVLVKGPTVARGYHRLPKESAEAFRDGWFYTGDVGAFDQDGFLTITDRKKDLFKTSNGKYVAPQKVENAIMATIPYASQAVVIGDDRPYVTALVALDPDALRKWAERRGRDDLSYAELTRLPEIVKSIDRFMRKVNANLERWEQIKRYRLLDKELSLAEGTLTPSLKVRRHMVSRLYQDLIDQMYADRSHSDLVD